jgi:hypothetical protein
MKYTLFLLILVISLLSVLVRVNTVYAAKEGTAIETEETEAFSKEDIIARLEDIFKYNADILASIPGLTRKEGVSGFYYEYNGIRLQDLDKDTLSGFLRNANQQISYRNFQRLQRELKMLKQIEDFNRTQRMLRQLRTPAIPEIPKVYTPPRTTTTKTYTPPKPYKPPERQ